MGLHTGEAIVLASAVTGVAKSLAGRARSYMDVNDPYDFKLGRAGLTHHDYVSMPSGHTTPALATASALNSEIEPLYPHRPWFVTPLLYGAAGLVVAGGF